MKLYASLYERLVASTELAVPDNPQSCWIWTGAKRDHYPCLCVRVPGGGRATKPRTISATRAMLEEVLEAAFPLDEAGHLCYNTLCVNPMHLEVQTKLFNMLDRRCSRASHLRDDCLIPVLFPRDELDALLDRIWDAPSTVTMECPF